MFTKKIELNEKIYNIDEELFYALFNIFSIFIPSGKRTKNELYLVGGCVRDLLLDRQPKDYDLCTNLTPDQVKKLFEERNKEEEYEVEPYTFIDTGLKHGTITIHDVWHDLFFEITTYRIDGKYEDGRHPDKVTFTRSLEEDLKRRDLTINSFAYDLFKEELYMLDQTFFYDLKFGTIRTVGNPVDRFNEDALRMLRAIRFASQLNFNIDKETYKALSTCAPLLANISKERIRDELTKILMSDNPQYLEFITTTGIEQYLFDGITPITDMVNCEHDNPWHYTTIFHHTMDVVRAVPKTFILRWSALFHDTGKPAVKKPRPQGPEGHFVYYGHPEKSAEIADKVMEVLKFSNDEKDLIHKFVLLHDYALSDVSNKKFKQKIVEIGEENFLAFIQLRQADALAHRLAVSTSFAVDAISVVKDRFTNYMLNPEPMRLRDLAISGNDIVADGFLQGKEIGDCLNWMLNIVLEHPEYNTREKLLELLETFKEMSFQST